MADDGTPSTAALVDLAVDDWSTLLATALPVVRGLPDRLVDDTVHITAEREREEREETAEHYLRSERTHRTMQRSIRLPGSVVEDEVEATCKNGVLTITLPKAEPIEPEGRKIDIEPDDES